MTTDATAQVKDPVCGMMIDPRSAAGHSEYAGATYFFCSGFCKQRFDREPATFVPGKSGADSTPVGHQRPPALSPERAVPPGALYSCPMHPQIVRDRPGSCPICGMALEPRTVTLEEGPNPELVVMSRRFWVGLALSLPIFLLAMGDMLPGKPLHHLLSMTAMNWVQLALATPVVFWCGWPFFERAWSSVIHRSPNMFTLIALGVGSAYLYSLVATVAPERFPEGFRASSGAVMPYFDTAVVVTVLILLGQVLEMKARGQTSGAIKRLLGLAPKTARASRPTGLKKRRRSTRSGSATCCAFGPAKRFRPTVSLWRAAVQRTSR